MSNEALIAELREAAFRAEMRGTKRVTLDLGVAGARILANILEDANVASR